MPKNSVTTKPKPVHDKAEEIGLVIDYLVDALGSDPCCPMRRAVIMTDIDEHPATTQPLIAERLGVSKALIGRDIEWLYDHGCVMKQQNEDDARCFQYFSCGYAQKNLGYALDYFDNSHKDLKNFLINYINLFGDHKPNLREAKVLSVIAEKGEATKQDIIDALYFGPASTENRAVNHLAELAIIDEQPQTEQK